MTMNVTPTTLELEDGTVRLEPLHFSRTAELLAAGEDEAVWTYLMERPRSLDEMQEWIERALAAQRSGRELPFAVVEAGTGRAIGSTRYEEIPAAIRVQEPMNVA